MELSGLAQQAAGFIEEIASYYGEDTTLRTVLLIAEVDTGDFTEIVTHGDDRPWVQLAFLDEAISEVGSRRDRLIDE